MDRDLCQGHGVCCQEAATVFRLDADGELELLRAEPPAELDEDVRRAVKHCPTGALRLEE